MRQTIPLTTYSERSLKSQKWIFFPLGVSFIVYGSFNIIFKTDVYVLFGVFQVMLGLFLFARAFSIFNPDTKNAPKLVLNSNEITVKVAVWSKTQTIDWGDVEEVLVESIRIVFVIKEKAAVSIKLNPNNSDAKRIVREFAELKGVRVNLTSAN